MTKKIFIIALMIGFTGGLLADFFLSSMGWLNKDRTTIINKTEERVITENQAVTEAVSKIKSSLVTVESYQQKKAIAQGNGFILSSDGLIVTALDLLSSQADQILISQADWQTPAQLIKKDTKQKLALLKIDRSNLPVVTLSDLDQLQLGQMMVITGLEKNITDSNFNQFVNLGTIRSVGANSLLLNINENNPLANGSPLIDLQAQVIGLNLVNRQGLDKIIPANKIKQFLEEKQ